MRGHHESYEREAKLQNIHGMVIETRNCLHRWVDFMAVAKLINPELCAGAFERRPCRRKLQYIGYDGWPEPTRSEMNAEGNGHFVPGETYYSYDFNGATYAIEGYTEIVGKVIGYAYFNWLEDGDLDDANDVYADTPLVVALLIGDEATAEMLLEQGADPNAGVELKPIQVVLLKNLSPNILRKLIAAGADVNIRLDYGKTALHMLWGKLKRHKELAQILLAAGADPNITDVHGLTPADYAKRQCCI